MVDESPVPMGTLTTMLAALDSRQADLLRITQYHQGDHRLAFSSQKFREAFGGLFRSFADNYLPLVVDAVEERLNVQGFRYGEDPTADKTAWGFWQANNLDAQSQLAHRESLIKGDSYAWVWGDDNDKPRVSIESAEQCIVAFAPGDRTKRVAGLKSWVDEDGRHAVLVLPDFVYRFVASGRATSHSDWALEDSDQAVMQNPLGRVSIVPLTNRPSLTSPYGVSEFLGVIPIQDAINKSVADMLVASEYVAFPQRFVTGLEFEYDDEGNPKSPFNAGLDKLLQAEDKEVKFGTLQAGSVDNYVKQIEVLVNHLATQTATPPQYFNIGGNLPSGDAIKAAETGLVAKARRKMRFYGEGWEEVIRLCFAVTGDPRADVTDGETIWADPEYRSEAEMADALVKRAAIGVPRQQLWEDAGYTQTQIARFHEMELADSLDSLLAPPGIPKVPLVPITKEN